MSNTANESEEVRDRYLGYTAERNTGTRRYSGFRNELKYLRRVQPPGQPLRFLDVACGAGLFTEFMVEQFKVQQGVLGYGFDIDPALVKTARERFGAARPNRGFAVGCGEQIPYRNEVFDLCIANSILEHAQDWEVMLNEIARVLKTSGVLVLYTTNRLHPFQQEVNHFPFYPWLPERIKRRVLAWIMRHRPDMVNYTEFPAIHWFTYEQLRGVLTGLKFQVHTRLDLIEPGDLRGWKAFARPILTLLRSVRWLRRLYYLYSRDVSIYAIKGPA